MNATNTLERTTTLELMTVEEQQPAPLNGKLYRFHGLTVLDSAGESVGQVDWIWSHDATGEGEFIGVGLRWLRGTARAIPARDIEIDQSAGTIRVAFTRHQIKKARRLSIGRALTAREKRAASSHYRTPQPLVTRRTVSDALAA